MKPLLKNKTLLTLIFWILVLVITGFEIARDIHRLGDFQGYINAGNSVIKGSHIYADYLNTWPPFFSIFAVPLAYFNSISPILIRFFWLIISIFCFFYSIKYFLPLVLNIKEKSTFLFQSVLMLSFICVFRFYLDNLSNLQINLLLFAGCLYSWKLHLSGKDRLAGFILAFCISLKVFPIFIFLFLMVARKWKFGISTLFFLLIFSSIPFLTFGYEMAIEYYTIFYNDRVQAPPLLSHRNQSLWSFLDGLLAHKSRGMNQYYNWLSLEPQQLKVSSLAIITLLFSPCLLWMKYGFKNTTITTFQFSFVMGAIPLLSPLAWKYYFIFLMPAYFILINHWIKQGKNYKIIRFFTTSSVILCTLTTDGIWGKEISNYFQLYGMITMGALLLLVGLFIIIYQELAKTSTYRIQEHS